ncbi:Calcipressin domain containing protein [Pyrenophora tritici-repentis]|nr:Calcipressin domain containing protein [Pyrenophora tritici-repentis]
MQATLPSPLRSRASSGSRSPLSLDLSSLPPLIEPSPPSNTLIITINMPKVHTWAPLKSFRRLVVSFFDVESAVQVRQALDGSQLMGFRIRVYFGVNTPMNPSDQHLALPSQTDYSSFRHRHRNHGLE